MKKQLIFSFMLVTFCSTANALQRGCSVARTVAAVYARKVYSARPASPATDTINYGWARRAKATVAQVVNAWTSKEAQTKAPTSHCKQRTLDEY